MIRINEETAVEVLDEISVGQTVTDTFSKTGQVAEIEVSDDGLYKTYVFTLTTGRVITTRR